MNDFFYMKNNSKKMRRKKVLVALSGGIDSSVSAILLKEHGYDLIGITLRMHNSNYYRTDPLAQSIKDASILANRLQIPYYVIDVQNEFNQIVINNFIDEYQIGRTPNPCALCNPEIKWKSLIEIKNEFSCNYIATGHYAQINKSNGRFFISKAKDETKDQSYFLWRLNQKELEKTIFPLGSYKKEEIKKIAASKGFNIIASKKESYNICFIPEGDYRKYFKELSITKNNSRTGKFVNTSGQYLGDHSGIENYTVGQRKGLEIFNEETLYVTKIISKDNVIVLGHKNELVQDQLIVKSFNLSKYNSIPQNVRICSKLNYKGTIIDCEIRQKNKQLILNFETPVLAISPGQSIAFYEGNDLIGGGIID